MLFLPKNFHLKIDGCQGVCPTRKFAANIQTPPYIGTHKTLCLLFVLLAGCQDPPLLEMQKARQAVERAKQEGASTYAPDLYNLAESELTIGEEEFKAQDNKIFWSRDYSMATRLMTLAQSDAQQALSLALEEKQKSAM